MLPHLPKENWVTMSPKRLRNAEVSPQQNRPDAKPNTGAPAVDLSCHHSYLLRIHRKL